MTDRENTTSANTEKKREELIGKVLVTNELLNYQDGTVASRMIVFKKTGTITLFAFDEGEGLSEHSAPFDAILTVTDGTYQPEGNRATMADYDRFMENARTFGVTGLREEPFDCNLITLIKQRFERGLCERRLPERNGCKGG